MENYLMTIIDELNKEVNQFDSGEEKELNKNHSCENSNFYLNKVILQCPICRDYTFKEIEDVHLNDGSKTANPGEECPFCCSIEPKIVMGIVRRYELECDDEGKCKIK